MRLWLALGRPDSQTLRDIFVSMRSLVSLPRDVLVFADSHRTAASAVMHMPVAA
jgi:hypothetical protein